MIKHKKSRHHLLKHILILSLFLVLGGCFLSVNAQSKNYRVLFISSYSGSFESVPAQIRGIQEVLTSKHILLDIEYMDTKRLDTQENIDLFYTTLKYKLKNLPAYDGIIVGDDKALDFVLEYQEELFYNLPITFLGINDFERAIKAYENPNITGIVEETSLKEIIDIAVKFNPKAKKVVALVENSITGIGDKNQFYYHQKLFPDLTFLDLNISDYSFDEMAEKISEIEDDTIVLFLSMYTDKTGKFITMREASQFLAAHSNVPIYRASIGGIGDGILGGKMISYEESGRIAANMLVDVFNGTPIHTIEMIDKSPNFYIFDYNIIEKFNIDESLIPKDAILINQRVSFYEENKQLIHGFLFVMIALLAISIILIVDNIKHRIMEKQLVESHDELSATYEELTATEEELRAQYNTIEEHIQEIKILNQKYENAIIGTGSVVWEVNLNTKEVTFSENISSILKQPLNNFSNLDSILYQIPDRKARASLVKEFKRYQDGKVDYIDIQIPFHIGGNTIKWIGIRGRGIAEGKVIAGKFHMLHGIFTDVTKSKEQEEYINHLAHHDYLTGLPNRIYFTKQLKKEMEKERPLTVVLMDIDNFKSINDTLGHIYGDKVLKEVANRLREFRDSDFFFSRFGGDEFTMLISEQAEKINDKIDTVMKRLKEPMVIDEIEHFIKYSLGITHYPKDSEDITGLIMNADTAMYKAKHNGKNQHLFYSKEMQEEVKDKEKINQILRKAVKEDGFYLVYHPQVSVSTGEIIGFEALLRLKEPAIPPNDFIPIAEETDLIFHIGRIVTLKAIRQAALWKNKGYPPKIISINFSSKQIKDKGYLNYLKDTLEEYNIEPKYLELEITESILMLESNYTLSFFESLKELGVNIALDDFGTGFSSINYLSYIPIDKVKLDKSLCDKFLAQKDNKIMKNIISLVHSFDIEIIAEGIEEMHQYEQLKQHGCDTIQGYLFSKPLIAKEAEKIYNTNFLS